MRFLAETALAADEINTIIDKVKTEVLYPLIALGMLVALLFFLWGMFRFIKGVDDETARATGKRHMLWGIIGLAIMVSAYGLYAFIASTINGFR